MKNKYIQLFIRSLPALLLLPFASLGQGIDIAADASIVVTGTASIELNNQGFINNGTYTKGSETVTFTGGTAKTISGTSLSDFYNLAITNSGGISIADNSKVTVSNILTVGGTSSLTLNSTSSGTASLIHSTPGVTATVQRYMNNADWTNWKDGWHFLGSPVAAQVISSNFTTDPYDFYCWYEPENMWVNYKNTSVAPVWNTGNTINNGLSNVPANFLVGKGYMAAYDAEGTKNFSGTLNRTDVAITGLAITGSTNQFRSWHLLGNPFASALTWDASLAWALVNISGTAKIWNELNQSYTDISSGSIPATNGFMVQAVGGAGSLTIPSGKRDHSSQAFYKSSDDPALKFVARNMVADNAQECNIVFNPDASAGFDLMYDGDFLAGYAPQFYAVAGDEKLSTNALPQLTPELQVPFVFVPNEGTQYQIEVQGIESLSLTPWLYDKKTNTDYDLSINPLFSYSAIEGDSSDRFLLHFAPLLGVYENETANDFSIYATDGKIKITSLEQLGGKINVTDITGRSVASGRVEAGATTFIDMKGKTGVHIVSVLTSKGINNTKIIVQ